MPDKKISPEDLAKAFEEFNKNSVELIDYFASLEKKVFDLTMELNKSKRLAAIGEMSTVLAHEIRNPLAGMRLSAEMLKKDLKGDKEHNFLISNILVAIHRLESIVTEILAFAQELNLNLGEVGLEELLRDAAMAVEYKRAQKHVDIYADLSVKYIRADAFHLHRVFVNLLENALDAVPENSGRIVIESQSVSGGGVQVKVADNGPGISDDIRQKILEPFFTTKERGVGLGLPICFRIVSAHGGKMDVRNREEGGAEIVIWLP